MMITHFFHALCSCNKCGFEAKAFKRRTSVDMIWVALHDRGSGEILFLTRQRVSLKGVYVWGVDSMVTKHSDYVWKDTSERVARRCEDASWQEASEFSCISTKSQKAPEMLSSTCSSCHVCKISWLVRQKKPRSARVLETMRCKVLIHP